MLKRLKSVSMLLLLMGVTCGAAYADTTVGVDGVTVTQQDGAAKGVVVDSFGPVTGASVVVIRYYQWYYHRS